MIQMLNIGGDFYISEDKILAILPIRSSAGKSIMTEAKENGYAFDFSGKKKKLSVIITASQSGKDVFYSAIAPKTLAKRLYRNLASDSATRNEEPIAKADET